MHSSKDHPLPPLGTSHEGRTNAEFERHLLQSNYRSELFSISDIENLVQVILQMKYYGLSKKNPRTLNEVSKQGLYWKELLDSSEQPLVNETIAYRYMVKILKENVPKKSRLLAALVGKDTQAEMNAPKQKVLKINGIYYLQLIDLVVLVLETIVEEKRGEKYVNFRASICEMDLPKLKAENAGAVIELADHTEFKDDFVKESNRTVIEISPQTFLEE